MGTLNRIYCVIVLSFVAFLSATPTYEAGQISQNLSMVSDLGRFKVGKPYTIKGRTYYPKIDLNYRAKGYASWYGRGFDGNETANGSIYDKLKFTAAHPTLPMPSVVKVTNLENKKSVYVVITDRGPFHEGGKRIIDVSRVAADALSFRRKGTAKVFVEYSHDRTMELIKSLSDKEYEKALRAFDKALL